MLRVHVIDVIRVKKKWKKVKFDNTHVTMRDPGKDWEKVEYDNMNVIYVMVSTIRKE